MFKWGKKETKTTKGACSSPISIGEMHRQVYESHGTAPQEFGTTQDYLYSIWLTFYLFYLSDLFEILGCPFLNGHFSTHATSCSLLCAISHSVNLLLSVSLTPSTAYFLLCFYLPLFYIKGNQFVWPASWNKLIWTNVAPELRFAHNNNDTKRGGYVMLSSFMMSVVVMSVALPS